MSKLTRIRHEQFDSGDTPPRFVELGSEEEDRVFDALSSETGRYLYRLLHEEPRPPSALAEATDKSLQTVTYHLKKLESARLIEDVGTHYSEKGNEMTVWAPAQEAVVIAEDADSARHSLEEYLGLFVGLMIASVAVQYAANWFVAETTTDRPILDPAGTGGAETVFDGLARTVATTLATVEPGLVVFLVGVLALIVAYHRRERAQHR